MLKYKAACMKKYTARFQKSIAMSLLPQDNGL